MSTRQTQPYRQGARIPSPALDAMRAGTSTPSPGAALMQAKGRQNPVGKGKGIRVPRITVGRRT